MWEFLRNNYGSIGVDLGSSWLKMVQLCAVDGRMELVAAAAKEVPSEIRNNPQFLHEWYIPTIKQLLASDSFKGKDALTCIPGRDLITHHLRLVKAEPDQLNEMVAQEAQERLPFFADPQLLRHVVAGEIYDGSDAKLEVIMMAVEQSGMDRHLDLLERTKLEINAIGTEPYAVLTAFAPLLGQESGAGNATMFVDLGNLDTRIVVAHGRQLAFCRSLNIVPPIEEESSTLMRRLCDEIRSCARYHDLVFQERPVTGVVFVGGGAKDASLCKELSEGAGLPGQAGDPLALVAEDTRFGEHSDLVADDSNCDWTVAVGLSLQAEQARSGQVNVAAKTGVTEFATENEFVQS